MSIKFNFEESELLNNFLEDVASGIPSKDTIIQRIENAISNTADPELITIAKNAIEKINSLNENEINKLFKSIPIIPDLSY
ncbi:MAG: hypothetical protein N4A54_04110 [Peptostreptococcaceae bacterium]|jgi:hypothetical protein|nr:hypothetical protein [Peptostreptococcaceae bacterium]